MAHHAPTAAAHRRMARNSERLELVGLLWPDGNQGRSLAQERLLGPSPRQHLVQTGAGLTSYFWRPGIGS